MVFYNCIKCGKKVLKVKSLKENKTPTVFYTPKGLICADCNLKGKKE